jgi:hypothetical protein
MDLEARLLATGVLTRAKISEDAAMARSRQETQREEEYDDDD